MPCFAAPMAMVAPNADLPTAGRAPMMVSSPAKKPPMALSMLLTPHVIICSSPLQRFSR
jgi:hypothetical protein